MAAATGGDPELANRAAMILALRGEQEDAIEAFSVEDGAGIKVLGVIPRLTEGVLYERHLGLRPPQETGQPGGVVGDGGGSFGE